MPTNLILNPDEEKENNLESNSEKTDISDSLSKKDSNKNLRFTSLNEIGRLNTDTSLPSFNLSNPKQIRANLDLSKDDDKEKKIDKKELKNIVKSEEDESPFDTYNKLVREPVSPILKDYNKVTTSYLERKKRESDGKNVFKNIKEPKDGFIDTAKDFIKSGISAGKSGLKTTKKATEKIGEEYIDNWKKSAVFYGTLLPGVRDDIIKNYPNQVIETADKFDKYAGGAVRTFAPSRFPLEVAEKIVGKDLAKSHKKLSEEYPVASAVSGLVGDIGNIYILSQLMGPAGLGIGDKIGVGTEKFINKSLPFLSNYAPGAATKLIEYSYKIPRIASTVGFSGSTWGVKNLVDEGLNQFRDGSLQLKELTKETAKGTLFGTLISSPMSATSKTTQLLGSFGVRSGWTLTQGYLEDGKIDSNDILNSTLNGLLGMFFTYINLDGRVKKNVSRDIYQMQHNQLSSTVGENNALLMEQSHRASILERMYPNKSVGEILEMSKIIDSTQTPNIEPNTSLYENLPSGYQKLNKEFSQMDFNSQQDKFNNIVNEVSNLSNSGMPLWRAVSESFARSFPDVFNSDEEVEKAVNSAFENIEEPDIAEDEESKSQLLDRIKRTDIDEFNYSEDIQPEEADEDIEINENLKSIADKIRNYENIDSFLEDYGLDEEVLKGINEENITKEDIQSIIQEDSREGLDEVRGSIWSGYQSMTSPDTEEQATKEEAVSFLEDIVDLSNEGITSREDMTNLYNKVVGEEQQIDIENVNIDKQEPEIEVRQTDENRLTYEEINRDYEIDIDPQNIDFTDLSSYALNQNEEYNRIFNKAQEIDPDSLTSYDLEVLRTGDFEEIKFDGIQQINEESEIRNRMFKDFLNFDVEGFIEMPVQSYKKSVNKIKDNIIGSIVKYTGLSDEMRGQFVKLEGKKDLSKEDLVNFFVEVFEGTNKEERELLTRHQENPEQYPISEELQPLADMVNELVEISREMQESRDLQNNFFPESFIQRNKKEIQRIKEVIPTLERQDAINRRLEKIDNLEEENELLENLRYAPRAYLNNQNIEQRVAKLIPEGRLSSQLKSKLTKLQGRKIPTIDAAEELGLEPELDIAKLMASHFEYLTRKIAIYDMMEAFKENPDAVLPEDAAPEDWDRVAIGQLDGYKVHPAVTRTMEDMIHYPETNIIGKGYDAINNLGKTLFFHNFLIMPTWNMFQGIGGAGLGFVKNFITPELGKFGKSLINKNEESLYKELLPKAFKEVINKGPIYREAVKRGIYRTPISERMPNSIENIIEQQLNQISEEYPGFKKAVEKITGRPVSWKTLFITPELYRVNHRLTWFLDRVQRTASFQHHLNKGATLDEAAEETKDYHANYDLYTKKAKKTLNRIFLTPTFEANMLLRLPTKIAKGVGGLGKNIAKGEEPTYHQKNSFYSMMRIMGLVVAGLSFAAYKGYRYMEGYRLVKKLDEPEITDKGEIVHERVVTLPGPFAKIPKAVERSKHGPEGIYMYLAKVPQIAWGLARNRRWMGEPYYTEGASEEYQRRELIYNVLRDYVAPIDTYELMTDAERNATDNLLSSFGLATYKRGSTEERMMYEIQDKKRTLDKFLKRPDIDEQDKIEAIESYNSSVEKILGDMREFMEYYDDRETFDSNTNNSKTEIERNLKLGE